MIQFNLFLALLFWVIIFPEEMIPLMSLRALGAFHLIFLAETINYLNLNGGEY